MKRRWLVPLTCQRLYRWWTLKMRDSKDTKQKPKGWQRHNNKIMCFWFTSAPTDFNSLIINPGAKCYGQNRPGEELSWKIRAPAQSALDKLAVAKQQLSCPGAEFSAQTHRGAQTKLKELAPARVRIFCFLKESALAITLNIPNPIRIQTNLPSRNLPISKPKDKRFWPTTNTMFLSFKMDEKFKFSFQFLCFLVLIRKRKVSDRKFVPTKCL